MIYFYYCFRRIGKQYIKMILICLPEKSSRTHTVPPLVLINSLILLVLPGARQIFFVACCLVPSPPECTSRILHSNNFSQRARALSAEISNFSLSSVMKSVLGIGNFIEPSSSKNFIAASLIVFLRFSPVGVSSALPSRSSGERSSALCQILCSSFRRQNDSTGGKLRTQQPTTTAFFS